MYEGLHQSPISEKTGQLVSMLTSASFQIAGNSAPSTASASALPCAFKLCPKPSNDHPLLGSSSRSSLYACALHPSNHVLHAWAQAMQMMPRSHTSRGKLSMHSGYLKLQATFGHLQ